MGPRLAGKNAFVTAAGQGIGRAVALAFAAEGAHVWATDVNEKLLESYKGVANVTTRRLDALDDQAIKAVIGEAGLINVLFNCSGFVHHGSVLDATDAQWDLAMQSSLVSQTFFPFGLLRFDLKILKLPMLLSECRRATS